MSTPAGSSPHAGPSWPARLPVFYGWIVIAAVFAIMAVSVSIRTAYSLLLPPLLVEFDWDRGLAAGAFSFGFIVTAIASPFVGRFVDRYGPRPVIQAGVVLLVGGLITAPAMLSPWHLYLSLGLGVGLGANLMSFMVQSLYLPNWFVRRRAFAISLAFSGVGFGAILLLPWLQSIIVVDGWRRSCEVMAALTVGIVLPLSFLIWKSPHMLGLVPDGERANATQGAARRATAVVDPAWVATPWTLARAMRTRRFWWLVVGYFCGLYAWYAVQVHQTKYLLEVGYSPSAAAWALAVVSIAGVPGQIGFGALADRIGREWVWTAGSIGFGICYAALLGLEGGPVTPLLIIMVLAQGVMGYALTSVLAPVVADIFEGPHYGAIFGAISVAIMAGSAAGPYVTGALYDATGSYRAAFLLAIGASGLSAIAVWCAAPRRVRRVGVSAAP
jgi:MFS family permease